MNGFCVTGNGWLLEALTHLQLQASLPVWKSWFQSLLGDKKADTCQIAWVAVRNLFICEIDAGGSCDVLFRVIITYPIDLDVNSSYRTMCAWDCFAEAVCHYGKLHS